jgi:hypothetical protein
MCRGPFVFSRHSEDIPGLRHLDQAGLAEGAAQEVLDQALDALGVARLQAHVWSTSGCQASIKQQLLPQRSEEGGRATLFPQRSPVEVREPSERAPCRLRCLLAPVTKSSLTSLASVNERPEVALLSMHLGFAWFAVASQSFGGHFLALGFGKRDWMCRCRASTFPVKSWWLAFWLRSMKSWPMASSITRR